MQELKRRLDKIRVLEEKLDAILIPCGDMQSSPNFTYFTNVDGVAGFFFYDFSKPGIFTNARDYTAAKQSWIKDVRISKKDMLDKIVKGKNIGVDFSSLTALAYLRLKKNAKVTDIGRHLENARAQKTAYEISRIRHACSITGKVLRKVENQWHGMTEIGFKGLIEYEMQKHGAEPAFPTIVAAGKNIAVPHHKPTTKKIALPLLIDLGVRCKNYVSDVTRTYGSRWQAVMEKILDDLYPAVKPNVKARDLDASVRKALGLNERFFITSLGHGIGLAVHEKPLLSKRSGDTLKENTVFTIEPGIYVNGGIRIENDFLLKEDGVKMLTNF